MPEALRSLLLFGILSCVATAGLAQEQAARTYVGGHIASRAAEDLRAGAHVTVRLRGRIELYSAISYSIDLDWHTLVALRMRVLDLTALRSVWYLGAGLAAEEPTVDATLLSGFEFASWQLRPYVEVRVSNEPSAWGSTIDLVAGASIPLP